MADNGFRSIVLKTIRETQSSKDETKGWGMWILQYIKDGQHVATKLVCGEYWTDAMSGEKRYRAKGMGRRDFETLNSVWKEVKPIIWDPPAVKSEEPASEEAHPEDPGGAKQEDIPF